MKNWERTLIGPETSLRDALQRIDEGGVQIVLVVSPAGQLMGTLSDGDARRGLLGGLSLEDSVTRVMNTEPHCVREGESPAGILSKMRQLGLHQIPIVDSCGSVVGLKVLDDFLHRSVRQNWVVVMAGGLGTRLAPLTLDTPKPMLRIGSRPLLETVLRGYAEQGFRHFWLAVNYKADQIESHFGDGGALGIELRYLRERQRLGTAGPLGLLPEKPVLPVVVVNGDLLTKEDLGHLVDRHVESGADATMGVREYESQVPFGVVHQRGGEIESIEEKPIQTFVVSAGMYVLSPEAVGLVPRGQPYDMPALFEALIARGRRTRCYPVNSYWLDIGRMDDLQRAHDDFEREFR